MMHLIKANYLLKAVKEVVAEEYREQFEMPWFDATRHLRDFPSLQASHVSVIYSMAVLDPLSHSQYSRQFSSICFTSDNAL